MEFLGGALAISLFSGGSVNFAFSCSFSPFVAFLRILFFLVDKASVQVVSLILASWTAWLPCKAFCISVRVALVWIHSATASAVSFFLFLQALRWAKSPIANR